MTTENFFYGKGLTIIIDLKAVERKCIAGQYQILYGNEPTEKQLNRFIDKFFPEHNTKDFSGIWPI